jgi:hypothetical protein
MLFVVPLDPSTKSGSGLYITFSIRKFTANCAADVTITSSFVPKASCDTNAICQLIIRPRFLPQKSLSLLSGFI